VYERIAGAVGLVLIVFGLICLLTAVLGL